LLTGGGRFADETNLPGQGYACMVRSPHAHALIASIDTGPAEGMPGVIAVLTGSDANLAAKFPGMPGAPSGRADEFRKTTVGRRTQTSPTDLFVAWPLTGV
jgi:CO/xanthine dehydrogenase Mo-binding subunit